MLLSQVEPLRSYGVTSQPRRTTWSGAASSATRLRSAAPSSRRPVVDEYRKHPQELPRDPEPIPRRVCRRRTEPG